MELRRFGAIVFRALGLTLLCIGTAYAAPSPCALLTTQQVSAVLGANFGKPIPAGAKICEWIATGPSGPNGTKKVELVMVPANEFATRLTPMPAPVTRTPLSIGDAANYVRDDAAGRHAVRAKGRCLLHAAGAGGSPRQSAGDGGHACAGHCERPLGLC